MLYRLYLILIITLAVGVDIAMAENSRYRVEVLVLTHLDHQQEPLEMRWLQDFSSALDFLQPPEELVEPGPEATLPDLDTRVSRRAEWKPAVSARGVHPGQGRARSLL